MPSRLPPLRAIELFVVARGKFIEDGGDVHGRAGRCVREGVLHQVPQRLEQHFAARCRAVVRIPYDPHLEEGAEVELDLLNPETADAYLALAAHVGDGFAVPRRPVSRMTPATRFA